MKRREFIKRMSLAAVAVGVSNRLAPGAADKPARPNFIIIFTDDQGYQDLGCFGSPNIKTPNIDKMAREGMKLTSFYAASVCTPSRAMLLTGCYAPRVGMPGVIWPDERKGLHPDEVTIADLLKTKGYATACIGKWHLGGSPQWLPTRQGFDSYYGVPYSNDMTCGFNIPASDGVAIELSDKVRRGKRLPIKGSPLVRDGRIIEFPTDQSQLTRKYTDQAVKFIKASKDKKQPFFLYLPHTMPHTPLAASENFKGKSKGGFYGDTIEEIDWSVGRLMACLKESGLDESTLVIFTSDNGPWLQRGKSGGSALPLRGGKTTLYEGGVRVPTVARWPGRIPGNTTYDQMASTLDVLPTIARLAGVDLPKGRIIDGTDMSEQLTGKSKKPVRDEFYYFWDDTIRAVRCRNWKLMLENKKGRQKAEHALYDLEKDISETTNLLEKHPDIVRKLTKMIEDKQKEIDKNARPAGRTKK
ncbi:MAG: sulfatase [Phycisphaerae bacterium]|jgi:arylsulfatase A-like enzyme|nr:sulfatase [Phycisphaerae bacterium]